jgi:hypothetical protein
MKSGGREMPKRDDSDEMLDALDALVVALRQNIEVNKRVIERAELIKRRRQAGDGYVEIVTDAQSALILDMVNENLDRLARMGARFRRAEAKALYDEGMTMERIAAVFRVTRQRVSALLRSA